MPTGIPSWIEDLLAIAEEDGLPAVGSKNHFSYLAYCTVRNDQFRGFFRKPRPAGHPLEFADLRFQWLRGQNGQKRGVMVGFVLPPRVCLNVALCSPREGFNEESGFFKATRTSDEMALLFPLAPRRCALSIAVAEPGTPDWQLFPASSKLWIDENWISIDAGPDPRQVRNLVSFPRGVGWLLGPRHPSCIDVYAVPPESPLEEAPESAWDEHWRARQLFSYEHRRHDILLRPIAERIASSMLLRWRRNHAQRMLRTMTEAEAAAV